MNRQEREKRLRKLFEDFVPFNKVLGLKVESFDPHEPKLRFDMKPELVGNPTRGILHGGVISAALDVMAGFSIHAPPGARKILHRNRESRPPRKPCRRNSHAARERRGRGDRHRQRGLHDRLGA